MSQIKELTQKELRRLGRRDLLVLMLEQAKQIEHLEQAMEELQIQNAQNLDEKKRLLSELAEQKKRSGKQIEALNLRLKLESEKRAGSAPRPRAFRYARIFLGTLGDCFFKKRQSGGKTKRKS